MNCRSSGSIHFSPPLILLNAHVSFWNSLVLTVVSFVFYLSNVYIFLRAYLFQEKAHRFVLASTAFIRAYKINSGKILCRRTFLHIHTFQHIDIAFLAQCFSLLSILVRCQCSKTTLPYLCSCLWCKPNYTMFCFEPHPGGKVISNKAVSSKSQFKGEKNSLYLLHNVFFLLFFAAFYHLVLLLSYILNYSQVLTIATSPVVASCCHLVYILLIC